MKKAIAPIMVCLALVLAAGALAETRYLVATKDTYLQSTNPQTNYGGSKVLLMGKGVDFGKGLIRTLVEFDLSKLPSNPALITAAKFSVYQTGAEPGQGTVQVDLHRATESWTEAGATWSSAPTFDGSSWGSAPLGKAGYVGWVDWDVTALVRAQAAGQYANLGWLLKVQNEDTAASRLGYYDSRETELDDVVNPPLLTVEIVPEPTSLLLLAVSGLFARRR